MEELGELVEGKLQRVYGNLRAEYRRGAGAPSDPVVRYGDEELAGELLSNKFAFDERCKSGGQDIGYTDMGP